MTIATAPSSTTTAYSTSDWSTRGTCVGTDPDALFVQGKEQRAAKVVPRVTLVTSVVLLPAAMAILGVGFVLGLDIDLDIIGGALQ